MGSNRLDESRRVVVTGMGVVTSLAENTSDFYNALIAGRSGIGRMKKQDDRLCSKIGGDLSDFDFNAHVARVGASYPEPIVDKAKRLLRSTPLAGRLVAGAALQAYVQSNLTPDYDFTRIGHLMAGHNVHSNYSHDNALVYRDEPEFIDPLYGLMSADTDALAVVSEILNLRGPNSTMGGACASGNVATVTALDMIRAGRADAVLVTGAPMDFDFLLRQGWVMMDAISYRSFNDTPEKASRPFDAKREGFVPSIGAAALILESYASARARNAPIQAEVLGAACTCSATRTSKPSVEAQIRAIRAALTDGRVDAERVDYVNAHATSTPLGDAAEVSALKQALGPRAHQIPVNSSKSMVGHCLTAASSVELVATILQMQNGMVHPTINQEERDPALDLDFVPNKARAHRIQIAMSNAFGFGGINSCVVLGSA